MNEKPAILPRILLAEDDTNLSFVIKDNLEFRDFEVTLCEDGEKAFEAFSSGKFDVCIVDVMLPRQDGFRLAEKIRQVDKDIPLIFLTAKTMKEDKITAFQLGADDYITKPFNIEELVFRIKVFLKRSGKEIYPLAPVIRLRDYIFDYANLDLVCGQHTRRLTQRQADLLKMLCDNRGQVVRREDLLKAIWGSDDYFAGRSMDVFISKLRKYLSQDPSIEIINYHGIGFKLVLHS